MTSKELSEKYQVPITLVREIATYFGIKLTAGKNGTDFTKTETKKFESILAYIVKLAGNVLPKEKKTDSKLQLSAAAIKAKRNGGKVQIELANSLIDPEKEKPMEDLEDDFLDEEEFDPNEDEPDIEEDEPFIDGDMVDDEFDEMFDEYEEETDE